MNAPGCPLPPDFAEYKTRTERYIEQASWFPFQWGRPLGAKTPEGMPTDFFRYDARRFKRMIERAEHMLRCLIIWLAYLTLHRVETERLSDFAHPCKLPFGGGGSGAASAPNHPDMIARGIPVYEPRLPAFRISLPDGEVARPFGGEGFRVRGDARSARTPRPRNDAILSSGLLIARLERLGDLLDSIEPRAMRMAQVWAGRLVSGETLSGDTASDRKVPAQHWRTSSENRGSDFLSGDRYEILPLKTHDPPDALLKDASKEVCDDLTALHDVALRAAVAFNAHCG